VIASKVAFGGKGFAVIGIMTPEEIEATLRRAETGRIACTLNDRPYIVPVSYAYADGCIYAYSALGRKIMIMREQPLVCFEVEEIDGPTSWRCVIIEGRYEELEDETSRHDALKRLSARAGSLVPRAPDASSGAVVFRLRPGVMSGRFERRDA
jgi:nitroimidazol reductase NimA-like FMN-containing flavoprotein (pyridoxamine 5'-phosphate oxidase superfamily)